MAGGGNIRQQLYDRIRESSKDEVILEEMIRLGFWPKGEGQPSPPDDLIKRKGELGRELAELYKQQAQWADPERALKEMHKQRKRAALERRKETKLRHERLRAERAADWAVRRDRDIVYLGADVSGGLSKGAAGQTVSPVLPPIADAKALADEIGISLAELRFLAFDRAVSRISHYQRFLIAKKAGGHRQISAPMPRLKRVQYWVLDNILAYVPIHGAAHGFAPGRSILSNAQPHIGQDVVVNLDMQDFFPTLTWKRVKGKFRGLGYSEAVATILALLCTEPDCDVVELDRQRLHVRKGPRRLPQGAPTSPALTNLICLRLDRRLAGLAAKLGFAYTRYADDMTFSASGEAAGLVGTLLKGVDMIVEAEGFTVHPDKTRVMRRHRRQEVTGLTVNERVGVPRDTMRRFRAFLHQVESTGPEGKSWGRGGNVLVAARGFAQFVAMVDAEAGLPLIARVEALARRHGVSGPSIPQPDFRASAADGRKPVPGASSRRARIAAPAASARAIAAPAVSASVPAPAVAAPAVAAPAVPAPSASVRAVPAPAMPAPAVPVPAPAVPPPAAPAIRTAVPAMPSATATLVQRPASTPVPPAIPDAMPDKPVATNGAAGTQPVGAPDPVISRRHTTAAMKPSAAAATVTVPQPAPIAGPRFTPKATAQPAPGAAPRQPAPSAPDPQPPLHHAPPRVPRPLSEHQRPQQPKPPVSSGIPKAWWLAPAGIGVALGVAGIPWLIAVAAVVVGVLAIVLFHRWLDRD